MESFLRNIEEKIRPLVQDKVKVTEQNRQNIFYFSKFSFDKAEFAEIYNFVFSIKQITIREQIDIFKEAVVNAVSIASHSPLTEREKISTLFSACFMHYYSTFAYEVANSFENFYTKDFIDLCKCFNISVINFEHFSEFSKKFYNGIQSVIKRFNYEKIKKMYNNYNYSIVQEKKSAFSNSNENNVMELLKKHLNNKNKSTNFFTKNILTHLITAKEHLVDLVLETHQKKNYLKGDYLIKTIQQIQSPLNDGKQIIPENTNSNLNLINSIDNNSKVKNDSDSMQIDDNSYSTASNTDENVSFYSKRILSELTKCEVDDSLKGQIDAISQKVDEQILDVMINQKENTSINMISFFICYIVEIPSNIIKIIPEYKDITYDLTLRFIVSAKNIYNRVMEIYLSIIDLKLTDVNTFMIILKKRNLQIKYADCFVYFFKLLDEEIRKEKDNWNNKMEIIFEKFIDGLFTIWEQAIQENGKKLTHFCIV